ncbi:hypothetical protein RvY_15289-2 [Ramazzottius varieornatus]|uniref:RRM domain-containing protein n=1 Tax=Ramazzottius varieornatus TaxID=947166 RepID=A0A1D1VUD0_RAMVA|nr:hypothetical protein RvY_15289-2 [Ramazzottius varieornatus]
MLMAFSACRRRKMVVSNLARETTVKSLVEYFRRYGQVNSVQMNGALKDDGPASAVLEFHNPISVKDAVERGQHVVDGQIVTCKPYQVDRVVESILWTTNNDNG